jgi:hypothetical protein
MKKKLYAILTAFIMSLSYVDYAWANEVIKIYSPYSPGHSGNSAMQQIIDTANTSQNIYKFILEFKPGGNQIIAVKSINPENSLAIISAAYVENINNGQLNKNDYVPIHALGDACWAVITNKPLTAGSEIVVGSVGFGNATHLTALALGEKYKFNVRYILFKSNNDALVNMAGNNGVDFVVEKYESYEAMRTRNSKLSMIAASCPTRLPQAPNVKTLKELGVTAPYVFNITVAHRDMSKARQQALSIILNNATLSVGKNEIYKLSAMRPPIFDGVSAQKFYDDSISVVYNSQVKYKQKIDDSKKL